MAFLCGLVGFAIIFFMLRRNGGAGRHVLAFVLALLASGFLFLNVMAVTLGRTARAETVFVTGLTGFIFILVVLLAAMVVALFVRRNATKNAIAPIEGPAGRPD